MGNQSLLWVEKSPNFQPILIINLSIKIVSINRSMQTNYKFFNSTLVLTHVTCMLPKIHVEFAIMCMFIIDFIQ